MAKPKTMAGPFTVRIPLDVMPILEEDAEIEGRSVPEQISWMVTDVLRQVGSAYDEQPKAMLDERPVSKKPAIEGPLPVFTKKATAAPMFRKHRWVNGRCRLCSAIEAQDDGRSCTELR